MNLSSLKSADRMDLSSLKSADRLHLSSPKSVDRMDLSLLQSADGERAIPTELTRSRRAIKSKVRFRVRAKWREILLFAP